MVEGLRAWADVIGRSDLGGAAAWLLDHPRPDSELVICHGDLHPFNVLIDPTGRVTLLDWSAALLGPRAYDVAFTSLMLANPPLAVPPAARPLVAAAGRGLAARFVRSYRRRSGAELDRADVTWHQAVVALRALVEVGEWVAEGVVEDRAGHPWLVSGDTFADRLSSTTGVSVRAR
jgi:aminoglycoside phosphotransferase (APT) family kinase protein